MTQIFLILLLQTIAIFIAFRKFYFDYDTIANIAKISLTGIPISFILFFLNLTSFSLYLIITSISILALYMEFVSYARKKDEGYIE